MTSPPEKCKEGAWETILNWKDSFHHWDFLVHSGLTRPSTTLVNFVRRNGIEPASDPLVSLKRLSEIIFTRFEYVPGSTSISSTIDHILDTGRGVCQDYAHVMIAIARTWGIPARYESRYLHDETAEDAENRGMTTHAWLECLLPGLGWVGFDPTNSTFVDKRHVRVAVGRDYQDVSPTTGCCTVGEISRSTWKCACNHFRVPILILSVIYKRNRTDEWHRPACCHG